MILGVLLNVISAQQDLITVPLRVGDELVYDISFVPTAAGAQDISLRFCRERKSDFGITEETIGECVDPVLTYLKGFVKQAPPPPTPPAPVPPRVATEPDMSVPLKVGEREFTITYQPTSVAAEATAELFCRDHGPKFGITAATFIEECVSPVFEYLKGAATREAASRATRRRQLSEAEEKARQLALQPDDIQVPMKIGEVTYNISWNSQRTNARNMAIKFCTEQGETINASFDDCLSPVEAHLTTQAAGLLAELAASRSAAPASSSATENVLIVKATVTVAGRDYEFRFEPSETDALRVARGFCSDNAVQLGATGGAQALEAECTRPILGVLMAALEKVK